MLKPLQTMRSPWEPSPDQQVVAQSPRAVRRKALVHVQSLSETTQPRVRKIRKITKQGKPIETLSPLEPDLLRSVKVVLQWALVLKPLPNMRLPWGQKTPLLVHIRVLLAATIRLVQTMLLP